MRPFRLAAASFLVTLAACGDATPPASGRSAAEWAVDLLRPSSEASAPAANALAALGADHATEVTDALVAAYSRAEPPADAVAFTVRLDTTAVGRLGLPPLDAPDAVALDLPIVRSRLLARGAKIGWLRGNATGEIAVVLVGAAGNADAARLAVDLCRRGALEFRAVFVPPRLDASAAREFEAWRAAEIELRSKAEREGAPYVPTRRDRRVVPVAGPSGADPTFVVVVEPTGPADAFDERLVAAATGFVGADGRGRVRITVDPARRDDLTRWSTPLVDREVAIERDGVVVEVVRRSTPWSTTIDVPAAGDPGTPADEAARAAADAAMLAIGRLPRPLEPTPPGEARSTFDLLAPAHENALVAVGPAAVPALERIVASGLPAPRRAVASRALAELRARAEARTEAERAAKARAEKAKAAPAGEGDPRDAAIDDAGPPPSAK